MSPGPEASFFLMSTLNCVGWIVHSYYNHFIDRLSGCFQHTHTHTNCVCTCAYMNVCVQCGCGGQRTILIVFSTEDFREPNAGHQLWWHLYSFVPLQVVWLLRYGLTLQPRLSWNSLQLGVACKLWQSFYLNFGMLRLQAGATMQSSKLDSHWHRFHEYNEYNDPNKDSLH